MANKNEPFFTAVSSHKEENLKCIRRERLITVKLKCTSRVLNYASLKLCGRLKDMMSMSSCTDLLLI